MQLEHQRQLLQASRQHEVEMQKLRQELAQLQSNSEQQLQRATERFNSERQSAQDAIAHLEQVSCAGKLLRRLFFFYGDFQAAMFAPTYPQRLQEEQKQTQAVLMLLSRPTAVPATLRELTAKAAELASQPSSDKTLTDAVLERLIQQEITRIKEVDQVHAQNQQQSIELQKELREVRGHFIWLLPPCPHPTFNVAAS